MKKMAVALFGAFALGMVCFGNTQSAVGTGWFDARVSGYEQWPRDAAKGLGGAWNVKDGGDIADYAEVVEKGVIEVDADFGNELGFDASVARDFARGLKSTTLKSQVELTTHKTFPKIYEDYKCGLFVLGTESGETNIYVIANGGASNEWKRLDGVTAKKGIVPLEIHVFKDDNGYVFANYTVDGVKGSVEGNANVPVIITNEVKGLAFGGCGKLKSVFASHESAKGRYWFDPCVADYENWPQDIGNVLGGKWKMRDGSDIMDYTWVSEKGVLEVDADYGNEVCFDANTEKRFDRGLKATTLKSEVEMTPNLTFPPVDPEAKSGMFMLGTEAGETNIYVIANGGVSNEWKRLDGVVAKRGIFPVEITMFKNDAGETFANYTIDGVMGTVDGNANVRIVATNAVQGVAVSGSGKVKKITVTADTVKPVVLR